MSLGERLGRCYFFYYGVSSSQIQMMKDFLSKAPFIPENILEMV